MSIIGTGSCLRPLWKDGCDDGSILEYVGENGNLAMLRWIGLERANAQNESVKILTYRGYDPTKSLVPDDVCCPGSKVITGGICTINYSCFGIVRLEAPPAKNGGTGLPNCVQDPRYTIGGEQITNDAEWNESVLSMGIARGINYQFGKGAGPVGVSGKPDHWGWISLLDGTADEAGYWDGCPDFKPHILDWNNKPTCDAKAQDGILWDGDPLAEKYTTNLYKALMGIYKKLRTVFNRMPDLNNGGINYGDIAIVGDPDAFECLMECAVCYTQCNSDITRIDSLEARNFMNELSQGGEGWGEIRFGNVRIPLIPYNPICNDTGLPALQNTDGTYNFAMIWRGSGANRPFVLQYNPLDDARFGATREDGLILLDSYKKQHCYVDSATAEWRIKLRNPCLQTWIKNVQCDTIEACDIAFPPEAQPDPIAECED